jgi:hypothetical protein
MRPRISLRARNAFTRYASAMLSRTQSVDVNWSYHTRSSSSWPFGSLKWSRARPSKVRDPIRRELQEPARLWCRVLLPLLKLPARHVRTLELSRYTSQNLSSTYLLCYGVGKDECIREETGTKLADQHMLHKHSEWIENISRQRNDRCDSRKVLFYCDG